MSTSPLDLPVLPENPIDVAWTCGYITAHPNRIVRNNWFVLITQTRIYRYTLEDDTYVLEIQDLTTNKTYRRTAK
jgi:hypothetical protein